MSITFNDQTGFETYLTQNDWVLNQDYEYNDYFSTMGTLRRDYVKLGKTIAIGIVGGKQPRIGICYPIRYCNNNGEPIIYDFLPSDDYDFWEFYYSDDSCAVSELKPEPNKDYFK